MIKISIKLMLYFKLMNYWILYKVLFNFDLDDNLGGIPNINYEDSSKNK